MSRRQSFLNGILRSPASARETDMIKSALKYRAVEDMLCACVNLTVFALMFLTLPRPHESPADTIATPPGVTPSTVPKADRHNPAEHSASPVKEASVGDSTRRKSRSNTGHGRPDQNSGIHSGDFRLVAAGRPVAGLRATAQSALHLPLSRLLSDNGHTPQLSMESGRQQ